MNKTINISYKLMAALRIILIVTALLLSEAHSKSLTPNGFLDGITIDLDWWIDLLGILVLCGFAFSVICQLLLGFAPPFRWMVFPRKGLVWTLFVLEILITAFLLTMAINEVTDNFFPAPPTFADVLLSPLIKTNESTRVIEKYQAVNDSLLALCSLFFVIFLWKYRKNWLAMESSLVA